VNDGSSNNQKNNNNMEEVYEAYGEDVYEDVKLIFHINDTRISSAIVKFASRNEWVCGNNNDEVLDSTNVIHSIQVEFKNINDARHVKRTRTKSRGYNDDEIIFASRLRPINETAPSDLAFDYFHLNDTSTADFYMKLPETRDGKCVLDNDIFDVIRFNENSQSLCQVVLVRDVNSNATYCQQYQQQVLKYLFNMMNTTSNYTFNGYLSDVHISKYFTTSDSYASWSRANLINLMHVEMREEGDKTFTCTNIPKMLSYKFFYKLTHASAQHVMKYEKTIDYIHLEFGQLDESQFQIDADDENSTHTIDIQINVQFINLYRSGAAKNHAQMHLVSLICFLSFLSIFVGKF
jgi:hypothetical protein